METHSCKNCNIDFTIEEDDKGFYNKLDVPVPTFCPDCRRQRRLAWRNDINFYPRECALCNKKVISVHAQNNGMTVYCIACWWSDKWDPAQYGKDVDFSRPMFPQMRELRKIVPVPALISDDGISSINCEYMHMCAYSKNCYMIFICWKLENCLYVRYGTNSKDCVDCESVFGNDELIYEGIFLQDCYNSRHAYFSSGLASCAYMYDCKGCTDCFMCFGLRQKRYYFKNEQYSKEDYEKIVAEYKLSTWSGSQKAYADFLDFIAKFPRKPANFNMTISCTGNDLIQGKKSKNCFNVTRVEDSCFFENGDTVKDSYDCGPGGECQYCYESITPDHGYQVRFVIESWRNSFVSYAENCHGANNIFGCYSLKKGSNAILNKQYTKEEYEILLPKVIEHMKTTGEFGEFFPAQDSYYGYNETIAQDFYPLTKEEASAKGYQWQDELRKPINAGTIDMKNIPEAIEDVQNSITNEVLTCTLCDRNYRIVASELDFYRKMKIPIPRHCFNCRSARRTAFRNPSQLWERECMCTKGRASMDTARHDPAGSHNHSGKCSNKFETSFSKERPEVIYCEDCYNKEII